MKYICEKNDSPFEQSCEKDHQSDELISLELAISEIGLLSTVDQEAQEVLFDKIIRLCTQTPDNQIKSCQNNLLFKIIELLSHHNQFSSQLIDKIFQTIETLGKCSISRSELKALVELLQPKQRFPYGLQILRCFVNWAKSTPSIGYNTELVGLVEQLTPIYDSAGSLRNQQAKHFFDFGEKNSGIQVAGVKKWPGYGFTFHCWLKISSKLAKKRRQLYSFYTDYGHGFEAFFTPDCSCLVVGLCNKKEFTSVQIRELNFDSSEKNFDMWHSIGIVHAPAKGPFGYSQLCVYIDGVLRKETNFKLPNFNDIGNIRICGPCCRPAGHSTGFSAPALTVPLLNFKNVFGLSNKSAEKALNMASIPAGSQDTIWEASTSLTGKMSSCFVLHDVLSEIQARLLHAIGPNQYSINWLDMLELSDLKSKFVFHFDAKCVKGPACLDLSSNKVSARFSATIVSSSNFKESLNSIGSVHIFYPLLNYLSSNQDYIELVLQEWISNSKKLKSFQNGHTDDNLDQNSKMARRSLFDDCELEQNVASLILNFIRYLVKNSEIFQDRFERNNGLPLLGFLLQKLPKKLIDINFLRICQEYVSEANKLANQSLLNAIYENIIFDFRIWNKAEYEIRIGHIQFLSTIIKDDKKYFRKKYGIQFFLDTIKTYFGASKNQLNSQTEINVNLLAESNQAALNVIDEDDQRNLRNSLFGLIKYYAQKDIRISELNAMISFVSITKNHLLQNDLLEVLIVLLEAPNSSDQLFLLLFEPNMADGLYSMLVQHDLNETTQHKLLRLFRILIKSKKVYEKNKSRIRLEDCGTYAGLISKITSELSHYCYFNHCFNHNLPLELLRNFLQDENSAPNFDNLWHILGMLVFTPVQMIGDLDLLVKARTEACEEILRYLSSSPSTIRSFTQTPAWQDTICQFVCCKRRDEPNPASNLPPIVVSSSSKINGSSDEMTNLCNETADWENMEINGSNEKQLDKNEVLTSTPSQIQKKIAAKATSSLNKNRINNKMKKIAKANSNDEYDCSKIDKEDSQQKMDSFSFSSPDFNSTGKNHEARKDQLAKNQEIDELLEKVLYLINKLMWESVQGSSIEDWKVSFCADHGVVSKNIFFFPKGTISDFFNASSVVQRFCSYQTD
ncbi:neurobeachin [Brachionus plicatilis]|uniref:Neurobeachin n=1 Tax=Brachionus plicatilis TaxID=10195 RepID=A0A3M7R442_BRAPC|nr:neurobeachin [Brachionus plicatilis]